MGIIEQTKAFVKARLHDAEGGHDWWHTYRVWRAACTINAEEKADQEVVELAALLHDVADSKFHDGDEEIGPRVAGEFLSSLTFNEVKILHIQNIIRHMSFRHEVAGKASFHSKEMEVVQDADRLDAIGALGIARAFSFGGLKKRPFYDPDIPPVQYNSSDSYKKSTAPTINHFYEKLFLLKDLMKTPTGKKLAEARHAYMREFVDVFMREWNGEV